MPLIVQGALALVGLGFLAMLLYAAVYIASEMEQTGLRPLGRVINAVAGAIIWGLLSLLVSGLLLLIGVLVWTGVFGRPVNVWVLQTWAIGLAAGIGGFYMLWGAYHGARNNLFRRH